MSDLRVFRAAAPVRLDFAGGWTDVEPFAGREGGVVVNAAIELRVHAEIQAGGDRYVIRAEDLGQQAEYETLGELPPPGAAGLALHQAALRRFRPDPCVLRTRSAVPAGSGLGSSGALGVALVAAFDALAGRSRGAADLAEEAFQLEAMDAGVRGGKQDQYAAALGGFHCLGFGGSVAVEPLEVEPGFAHWLEDHLVLCYTGSSRVSAETILRVMGAYERGDPEVTEALRRMADLAEGMAVALRAGDRERIARVLRKHWGCQQALDRGMQTEAMRTLEYAMQRAGALAGKAAGAGAGGCMFFLVSDPRATAHAAARAGARVLPFRWAQQGVTLERAE